MARLFPDEMFNAGRNDGLRRLLLRRLPHQTLEQILREPCSGAWRQAAPRRRAFLQLVTGMPPAARHALEMQHWRGLAEIRAMVRKLLSERAPDYRPAPRKLAPVDGQTADPADTIGGSEVREVLPLSQGGPGQPQRRDPRDARTHEEYQ
eukprot:9502523-Pyramimonas_sp.AAC.1